MVRVRPTPKGLPPELLVDGIPVHSKCATCLPAQCCHYVALETDKPTSKADFEDLLWFVAHDGVSVYVDEGSWYVQFETRCSFLAANNLCQAYDRRPRICVEYHPDECDRDEPAGYDHHFHTFDELYAYARKRFKRFATTGEKEARKRKKALARRRKIRV